MRYQVSARWKLRRARAEIFMLGLRQAPRVVGDHLVSLVCGDDEVARIVGGMDNVGMSQLHAISPFTSQERALVTSWAAPPAWVPGRGKYLIKSGGRMELPVSVTPSTSGLALNDYDSDCASSNISAGSGDSPGNVPGVTTKGKAAS